MGGGCEWGAGGVRQWGKGGGVESGGGGGEAVWSVAGTSSRGRGERGGDGMLGGCQVSTGEAEVPGQVPLTMFETLQVTQML